MEVVTPICKNLCKDCQHVINREKTWGWTRIKDSCYWKCASKKKIDCKTGQVEFIDCDNYHGECDRFTPLDEDNYNPTEHLLP
jgi:hypothetical protein